LLCPHLARPTPFLFPLSHRGWERPYLGAGVLLYDLLGGARSSRMPWHRHLSRRSTLSLCPAFDPRRVRGAVQYYDVIFDDARHTMLVARTAVHYGAVLATRTPVVEMLREGERIVGVRAVDAEAGESFAVSGRCVINAAGAWVDRVQELAGDPQVRVQPSKGVHLVVPRDRIDSSVGMVTRTADSVLFVRPWGERCWIVGTTDTPWEHGREEPAASGADVDYLLNEVNTWLSRPLTRADIVGVYAGVRPLVSTVRDGGDGASTAALSRDHAVLPGPEGMFTIVGGKYTTYRRMAKDVIDAAAGSLGRAVPSSVTDRTPLLGAEGWDAWRRQRDRLARRVGLSARWVEHLIGRYGTLAEQVIALVEARPPLGEPLPGGGDYLQAEIVYAATHEGALTLEDVLARRTHVSIETPDRGTASAEPASELMGEALGWTPERRRGEVAGYRGRVEADWRSELAHDDEEAVRAQLSPENRRQESCAGSRSAKNRS
jgi:glycerol-3-phosphate dehydrogenase